MRKWWPEKQDGFSDRNVLSYINYVGSNMLQPGAGSKSDPFQRVSSKSTDETGQFLSLVQPRLDNPIFTLDLFAPQGRGQFLVSLDLDLSMYYWQENQTPFVFNDSWDIEVSPTDWVTPVGDWIVSKVSTSPYHARFLGSIILYAKAALKPFTVRAGIRCGTSTAKGQWMISSFRCESYFGAGRLALPGVLQAQDCAGNADEFEYLDLSELPNEIH